MNCSTGNNTVKTVRRLRFVAAVPRVFKKEGIKPFVHATHEVCEFSLGLGPCGRVVTELTYSVSPEFLTITQKSYPEEGPGDVSDELSKLMRIHNAMSTLEGPEPKEWDLVAGHMVDPKNPNKPIPQVRNHNYLHEKAWYESSRRVLGEASKVDREQTKDVILDRIEGLQALLEVYKASVEIKTFTYKISDILGRIEATSV